MLTLLIFLLVGQVDRDAEQYSAVYSAAVLIASDLDVETKALFLETPPSWTSSVFDEILGREIRNRFGLRGGPGANVRLLEECRDRAPKVSAELLPYVCSSVVLDEILQMIRDSVNAEMRQILDQQLHALEITKLPEDNNFTQSDYHLVHIVDCLNVLLEENGWDFEIIIDPDLLERSVQIGEGRYWEPVLRKRPGFHSKSVLDVLRRIRFELSTCIRRSPDVVWIGDDCSSFQGTNPAVQVE